MYYIGELGNGGPRDRDGGASHRETLYRSLGRTRDGEDFVTKTDEASATLRRKAKVTARLRIVFVAFVRTFGLASLAYPVLNLLVDNG